ncbi:MAG: methylated-DNA--[protein]-cysteine S-methyltransferase [Candidatus Cloacimonetes bacterium]|nr:methylated-DNA--[protein]-cysteine S-methyltransferase [Candidatus Cloacimonadota bacterium]
MKFIYRNGLGDLTVTIESEAIVRIDFGFEDVCDNCDHQLAGQFKNEMDEYFAGTRREFEIPYLLTGSEFQLKVWQALTTIKYGETCSYSDIAEMTGMPSACRAVANAIGANPLPIIIPCHRVVRKSGNLGGFRGGVELKKSLLKIEET